MCQILFFNKVAGLETLAQFSCEFFESSKNTYFYRTLLVATSGGFQILFVFILTKNSIQFTCEFWCKANPFLSFKFNDINMVIDWTVFNSFLWSIDAVVQRCSVKKKFLKISQNSQENTCAKISFLIKLQASAGCFWKYYFLPSGYSLF